MNKILLAVLLITSATFAADPDYFKGPIKGTGVVDALNRVQFTLNPGTLSACQGDPGVSTCELKNASFQFEQNGVKTEFAVTKLVMIASGDTNQTEYPTTFYHLKGMYTDLKTVVTIGVKDKTVTGTMHVYDPMYGNSIASMSLIGKLD